MKNNVMPPFSVIDMGSNSIRLCIFDDSKIGDAKKIKYVETCQMGEGFQENLTITKPAFERSVEACKKFVEISEIYGVKKIYAFATATLREAVNRQDFISACRDFGLEIHILSGEQEALSGFLGACVGVNLDACETGHTKEFLEKQPQQNNSTDIAIFDIGGASTEIAIGDTSNFEGLFSGENRFPTIEEIIEKSKGTYMGLDISPIKFSHSFKVGAVRLTDKFKEDFTSEKEFLQSEFSLHQNKINLENVACFGIGGTITSLCGLILGCENYKPQLHGFSASFEELSTLSETICSMPPEDRKSLPYLKDKRKNIIASGSVILTSSMAYFGAKNITASLADNLEGYRAYLGI